jgi:hypothetical protein
MRVLNAFLGSMSIVLLYIIGRKLGDRVGHFAASIMIFFPFTLNYEVLALHEPMMGLFVLMGLLFFLEGKDFYSGLFIGLSYLCHFTAYIMVPIFMILYLFYHRSIEKLISFASAFCLIYIPYAYILQTHTGDAFYNIRTLIRFIGISTDKLENPMVFVLGPILLLLGIIAAFKVYRRASGEATSILTLFAGYSVFWGFFLLFVGTSLRLYELRYYWVLFMLSALVLGFFLQSSTQILHRTYRLSMIAAIVSAIFLFLFSSSYSELQNPIQTNFVMADILYENYEGGTILSPVPDMTYQLVSRWNVSPQNILGPLYCPQDNTEKLLWLEKNNVTLLFWLADFEADQVFSELASGKDNPPFYLLETFPYNRYIYEIRLAY